jgi:hypothetical protein
MDYVKDEPVAFATRTLVKLVRLHDRETFAVAWNQGGIEAAFGEAAMPPLKLLATGYWYLILAGGLAGAVVLLRREGWRGIGHPVVVCWAYFAVTHAVIVISDRYHAPAIPFVAILAAAALAAAVERRRQVGETRVVSP